MGVGAEKCSDVQGCLPMNLEVIPVFDRQPVSTVTRV